MTSPHLEAERDSLLARLETIRNSGAIAPPHLRIEPDFLTPKGWILTHTNLPMRERQLGIHGSYKYHDWEERIHRRDQIQELETQLSIVQALLERQAQTKALFAVTAATVDFGDVVEFAGDRYVVQNVGFRYLQLMHESGKVVRCEIDEAKLLSKLLNSPMK